MRRSLRTGLALLGLLAATPGFALYKVVGPDGKVSYTDRPPGDSTQVQALPPAAAAPAEAALPFELRQVVQRFPVTLYTTGNCAPCDKGRALLRQRGVPHVEKTISSAADREAYARLGGQPLPLLQIGAQQVPGFLDSEWHGHLDAAGYPARSRLPRSHPFAAATPLAGTPAEAAAVAPPPPPPSTLPSAPPSVPSPANPPGFRF